MGDQGRWLWRPKENKMATRQLEVSTSYCRVVGEGTEVVGRIEGLW